MGWKNIHTRFDIQHITQIRDGKICIGSGYIGDIIAISFDGKILKMDGSESNKHLKRYALELREAEASGELKRLIETPDTFENLVDCYTYEKGRVIKKQCEIFGYPEVCTDGELMYENTHFLSRKDAHAKCKSDAKLGLMYSARDVKRVFIDVFRDLSKVFKRFFKHLFYFTISNFQ